MSYKPIDPAYHLLYALHIIANEPYELSHEKIVNQRDFFKKLAKEGLDAYYDQIDEKSA